MSTASPICSRTGAESFPSHASGDATPSAPAQSNPPTRRKPTGDPATLLGAVTANSLTRASSMNELLSRLEDLDSSGLRTAWRQLCRSEPTRISRDLLMRAVAYRLQELACLTSPTSGVGRDECFEIAGRESKSRHYWR